MTQLEVLIYYKGRELCRFYEWDDIKSERDRTIVYHSDGESTVFEGRNYSYSIIQVNEISLCLD